MIQILVTRNEHGHVSAFEISGHAESGPYGHDLVCAAVSAVSFGSVNAVMQPNATSKSTVFRPEEGCR